MFWALHIYCSQYEKQYQEFLFICLFRSYNNKSKFSFLETMQSSCNTSYLRTSDFCAKCQYCFFALIFLSTFEKIPWKNCARFWKWNLEHNSPVSLKLVFEKIKFKVLLYNQHDFRLAYLKALLLTFQPFSISTFQISSHIVMVILKVTNISLFIKVGAANFLLKLNYLQSREETHSTERYL